MTFFPCPCRAVYMKKSNGSSRVNISVAAELRLGRFRATGQA